MSTPNTNKPTLIFDINLYDHYLENSGLTEAEKQEFLQMMWDMICNFVMLGFHVQESDKITNIITINDKTTLSSIGSSNSQIIETTQKKEASNA